MPYKAARPCAYPGCPRLVREPGKWMCAEHQREYEKEQDARRGSAAERGYDARWREIRDRFLAANPTCEKCGATATVAHHIIRRREGGKDHPRNLMALCASCHSRLHATAGHNWDRSAG